MRSTCCSNSGAVSPMCAMADTTYPSRLAFSAKIIGNRPFPAISPILSAGRDAILSEPVPLIRRSTREASSSVFHLHILCGRPADTALRPFDKGEDFQDIGVIRKTLPCQLDSVSHPIARPEQDLV